MFIFAYRHPRPILERGPGIYPVMVELTAAVVQTKTLHSQDERIQGVNLVMMHEQLSSVYGKNRKQVTENDTQMTPDSKTKTPGFNFAVLSLLYD